MEIGEKFLPIGTVVLLKGGKKELMITSYCVLPNNVYYENGAQHKQTGDVVFDYGACSYPEGIVNVNTVYAFNHNQIERVCYKGYETDNSKNLSRIMLGSIDEFKEKLKKQTEESQN